MKLIHFFVLSSIQIFEMILITHCLNFTNFHSQENNQRIICQNFFENQDECLASSMKRNNSGKGSSFEARLHCLQIHSAAIQWSLSENTTKNFTFAIQIFSVANQSNDIYFVNDFELSFDNLTADTQYDVLILMIPPTGTIFLENIVNLKFTTKPESYQPPESLAWFNVTHAIPVNETIINIKVQWNYTNEDDLPCFFDIGWRRVIDDDSVTFEDNNLCLEKPQHYEYVIPNLQYDSTYRIRIVEKLSDFGKIKFSKPVGAIYYNTPLCLDFYENSTICEIPPPRNITVEDYCLHEFECYVYILWSIPKSHFDDFTIKIEKLSIDRTLSLFTSRNVKGKNVTIPILAGEWYKITITTLRNGVSSKPTSSEWFVVSLPEYSKPESKTYYYFLSVTLALCIFLAVLFSRMRRKCKTDFPKKYTVELPNLRTEFLLDDVRSANKVYKYRLILGKELGRGNFGVVFQGSLIKNNKKVVDVAVKTLQNNATIKEIQKFEKEIHLMKEVGLHKNIVCLIGSCYDARKPLLIVEYCSLGDLRTYLCDIKKTLINFADFNPLMPIRYKNTVHNTSQEFKYFVHNNIYGITTEDITVPELSVCDLLSFGRQVAVGMEFLASIRVIHRDLAARNVLLCHNKTVKISDFGLSRDIYEENIYRKMGGSEQMPIKWMALESIRRLEYTVQSDVWSFGVLLWELFTMGDEPYEDISCAEVLYLRLKEGYRMTNPCPFYPELYDIMLSCWQENPDLRPSFSIIYELLDQVLKKYSPHQYITVTGDEYSG